MGHVEVVKELLTRHGSHVILRASDNLSYEIHGKNIKFFLDTS